MSIEVTPQEKEVGKGNFNRVVGDLGVTRRDFMKGLIAAGATLPVSAAAYFGYQNHRFPRDTDPVKAGLIGAGDEGGVLVGEHNPNFVNFIACSDIRPSNQKRIFAGQPNTVRRGFNAIAEHIRVNYGSTPQDHIRVYEKYEDLLDNPEIELVVIALPLHLHAEVAIKALQKGKHVLCEKLMAWNITQCKAMIRAADTADRLLAIGHQRHYSMLYAHANEIVREGILGDIKHIRALWHRNNVRPNPDPRTRAERPLLDSWYPIIPAEDEAALKTRIREFGYKDMKELVRWRLYNRTGGGLMAELGSHQLDACSIFLGKKHPLTVTATGGKHFYTDDREVEDHVYCIYEFPGPKHERDPHDIVTVTYSSISTSGFEPYGECVMGTKGTLVVEQEQNAYLWGIQGRSTDVSVNARGASPVLDASSTTGPPAAAATAASVGQTALGSGPPSKGYREEMEHLAYCIRMRQRDPSPEGRLLYKPRCDGRAAMADAIVALSANLAMKHHQRIVFQDSWFKDDSADVPDAEMIARGI